MGIAMPEGQASTVMPKMICDFGVSSICMRGSSVGSLESSRRRRPSRGRAERAAGKLTVMVWAETGTNAAARRSVSRRMAEVYVARGRVVRPMDMRRTAWIWAVGCVVWIFDGLVHVRLRQLPHAELAFVLAAMFFVAWICLL